MTGGQCRAYLRLSRDEPIDIQVKPIPYLLHELSTSIEENAHISIGYAYSFLSVGIDFICLCMHIRAYAVQPLPGNQMRPVMKNIRLRDCYPSAPPALDCIKYLRMTAAYIVSASLGTHLHGLRRVA